MSACTRASSCAQHLANGRSAAGAAAAARAAPGAFPRAAPRRGRVAARAGADPAPDRPLFKLSSRGPEMSLDDIRDAYEVCSLIPSPNERSQCYSCWGIDSERMMAYYDAVLGLEAALGASATVRVADPDEFQSAQASMAE